ncbi:unnamed protein product [Rhodiola kirilowii]
MSKNLAVPDLSKLQPLEGPNYHRWSEELLFFLQELGLHYVLSDNQPAELTKSVVALDTLPPITPAAVNKDKPTSSR